MECNNQHCVFCMFDQCCHESEEGFDKATPNELDCPSSVRVDQQQGMYLLQADILDLTCKRNLRELLEIKKFIENQRGVTK